jgi:thioredoxin-related protein
MRLIKFKQDNCTPCKMLEEFLTELGVKADKEINLSTTSEMEDFELAGKYGVTKTPLLVLEDDNGNKIAEYKGVGQKGVRAILEQRGLI